MVFFNLMRCPTTAIISALLTYLLFQNTYIFAAELDISDSPLFLEDSVTPNIFIELDDSGSMDLDILTSQHWLACTYDNDTNRVLGADECPINNADLFVVNGSLKAYVDEPSGGEESTKRDFVKVTKIYKNNDDVRDNQCNHDESTEERTLETCGYRTAESDWRVFSAALNTIYYNPKITYTPWHGFADGSFSQARSNPQAGTDGYTDTRDLGITQYRDNTFNEFTYYVWIDDKGYSGTRPLAGENTNMTFEGNGEVDLWDSYYKVSVTNGSRTVKKFSYSFNETAGKLELSSSSATLPIELGGGRTLAEEQKNIANWYQYARRRSLVAKGGISSVVVNNPNMRYGLSVINKPDELFIQVPPETVTTTTEFVQHNEALLNELFKLPWSYSWTPLPAGLKFAGDYYDNSLSGQQDSFGHSLVDPIFHECQQNFTLLLTDGYWNQSLSDIGNSDGDGHSNTLADVAKYYYDKDLSGLPDNVRNNPFDSADHQHMVTFGIAFGVKGKLVDTDEDGWPNPPKTESSDWGDPTGDVSKPEKIDDLWHAAYNSRGAYASAKNPEELNESLQAAIQNISDRNGAAAAVAITSGVFQAGTAVIQVRFNSTNWSGEILKYPVNAEGSLDFANVTVLSEALENQDWETGRAILTYKPSESIGILFPTSLPDTPGPSTLDQEQIDALDEDGKGQARLEFLRGKGADNPDAAFLKNNNFRPRNGKLGSIVSSDPIYVAASNFRYPDDLETGQKYSIFRNTHKYRTPIIYVGANDSMLHAFDASTGREIFAYVPSEIYNRLSALSDPDYAHQYFVDGPPTVSDAFYGGAWHTVLVGGLRAGGQGIYALDVSNPAVLSPDSKVLWEFNDYHDADLGYTFSQPAIARMANGKWAAIFGNGLNNTEDDGHASSTGKAVLYIVDIETGALMKKISTDVGSSNTPNGLASPAAVDVDYPPDYITDYIYAGDLRGNLWKFDVTSQSKSGWKLAYGKPLFEAKTGSVAGNSGINQPITTRPEVDRHPLHDGFLVYFGTGKYIEDTIDNAPVGDTQTFYAVWDKDENTLNQSIQRAQLLEQKILEETTHPSSGFGVRVTSRGEDDDRYVMDWIQHRGWYMDLVNQGAAVIDNHGEKQVSDAVLRNKRIIFTTLIPSEQVCDPGGDSWLMVLDATDGSRLEFSPFDFTQDLVFNEDDLIESSAIPDEDKEAASGKLSTVGIISRPGMVTSGPIDVAINSGSSGNMESSILNPGIEDRGRQAWQQLSLE